jgi:hypothetical protein
VGWRSFVDDVKQSENATDAGQLDRPDQVVGIDHQAQRLTPPSGSAGDVN